MIKTKYIILFGIIAPIALLIYIYTFTDISQRVKDEQRVNAISAAVTSTIEAEIFQATVEAELKLR